MKPVFGRIQFETLLKQKRGREGYGNMHVAMGILDGGLHHIIYIHILGIIIPTD
jgi:hypothetical protein